jgi:hypothetical protein
VIPTILGVVDPPGNPTDGPLPSPPCRVRDGTDNLAPETPRQLARLDEHRTRDPSAHRTLTDRVAAETEPAICILRWGIG